MSSSIYQGLQPCLEPRLTEPRVLRLKLTPSKPNSSRPAAAEEEDSELEIETQLEMGQNNGAGAGSGDAPAAGKTAAEGGGNGAGGWSFLQALSGVYAHPPAKQYSPATLSGKSLEMCTESLGSETGSDGSEIGGDEKMSLFLLDETEASPIASGEEPPPRFSRLSKLRATKKLAKPSYPPPLTSMNGSTGVKVKPYREEGRLVLKAEPLPSVKPCFEVERSNGRLRLRLAKEHCMFEEDEEGREEESNIGKLGMGRRCKCKEGGGERKGLLNWKPFLLST